MTDLAAALFVAGLAVSKAAGTNLLFDFRLQANALAIGAEDPRDPVFRLLVFLLSLFAERDRAVALTVPVVCPDTDDKRVRGHHHVHAPGSSTRFSGDDALRCGEMVMPGKGEGPFQFPFVTLGELRVAILRSPSSGDETEPTYGMPMGGSRLAEKRSVRFEI